LCLSGFLLSGGCCGRGLQVDFLVDLGGLGPLLALVALGLALHFLRRF
jgi:hypothetical protein